MSIGGNAGFRAFEGILPLKGLGQDEDGRHGVAPEGEPAGAGSTDAGNVTPLMASTDPVSSPVGAAAAVPAPDGRAGGGPEKRRFAINAAAGGATNALKIGIQLVMLPLMAHLLGPAEFGLYALALPTVAFFMALADGGLGTALAREREHSTVIWSTAFWLLLGVGIALALIVSGWGIVLADLSKEPKIRDLMGVLSLSFLLITVSVLPTARLMQQGRLVVFNAADLGATLVGAAVAVGLAASGAGAMSLAVQYVVTFLVRATILNTVAFVRPTLEFRLSSLKTHISTGSSLMGGRLSDFCGRLLENLVYSRALGAAALGTYTFANQAPRFLCEAASGPVWGALYAHALRADQASVAALHVKVAHLLAAAVFPMAFLLSATAPEFLGLLLGPKWDEASTLLRIIIPFYALVTVAGLSGAVLVAKGRGWLLFWLIFAMTGGRVAAVYAGSWIGPVVVAWGIGLVLVIVSGLLLCAPARTSGSSAAPLLRGLIAPILSGAIAGIVAYLVLHARQPGLAWIAVSLLAGGSVYLAAMMLVEGRRLRSDADAMLRIVRGRGLGR